MPSRRPQSATRPSESARRAGAPPVPTAHATAAIHAKPGPHQMSTMLASRRASETSQRIDIAAATASAVAHRTSDMQPPARAQRITARARRSLSRARHAATMAAVSFVLDAAATRPSRAATAFEGVFSLRANLFEDFRSFYALFWEKHLVDPALLELCRLRI